jgi:hypothetical protein
MIVKRYIHRFFDTAYVLVLITISLAIDTLWDIDTHGMELGLAPLSLTLESLLESRI